MDLGIATSIAEIIATVDVVVSLIYIAREFRRSLQNAGLERFSKAIETQVHQFAHLADEPEKAELVRRALADLDQLDRGQQGQFSAIIHDILLSHDLVRREPQERHFSTRLSRRRAACWSWLLPGASVPVQGEIQGQNS